MEAKLPSGKTGYDFGENRRQQLVTITEFNIRARYDDYKLLFYKRATQVYAKKYFAITQALLLWLDQNE